MAPAAARAALESLLRERKLDTTLTTALPLVLPGGDDHVPTGMPQLDAQLRGGVPRGQVSEIVGPRSSGRTSALRGLLAGATRRGELVALIDTLDRFDPTSAAGAGVDLARLLWVRGQDVPLTQAALVPGWEPSRPRRGRTHDSVVGRTLDRAVKALTLVLQSGGFGLVALDLADVPLEALRDLPFNTWMRLHRVVDGSDTACVLVADVPVARSAGGVSIRLQPRRRPLVHSRDQDRCGADLPPSRTLRRTRRSPAEMEEDGGGQGGQDRCDAAQVGPPPRRSGLAPAAFHAAVAASRRPFTPRPVGGGVTGCWAGTSSPLPRLRGLAADASVVRAQHHAPTTAQVPLEFVE